MESRRLLEEPIRADLARKMVFVAGPRQVGKTTLARRLLAAEPGGLYLSWDRKQDRARALAGEWAAETSLVVVDELHKYRHWKRWLKGEFDRHRDHLRFLVTGSARMDVYRRGGDSLQGRYHHYRLHPFTCRELLAAGGGAQAIRLEPGHELPIPTRDETAAVQSLLRFSGFPEPLLAATERELRRWRKDRVDRFFREDVRELEHVTDLSSMQLLADLLDERVGSPLSLNALREDLDVSHRAVSRWLDVLERLYFSFRVAPHVHRRVRALKKMSKLYLWDFTPVAASGPRFENLVALHLLRFCHWLEDVEGYRVELRYLRDRDGREVDFLVVHDGKPWFAVEAKLAAGPVDPALAYYRDRLSIPFCYQVALAGDRDFIKDGIRVVPAGKFLAALA